MKKTQFILSRFPVLVFLFLTLFTQTLYGCGGEQDAHSDKVKLTLVGGDNIPALGGDLQLIVTCAREWGIVESPQWCELSATSGEGSKVLTMNVLRNNRKERSGEIVISSYGVREAVEVRQKAGENIVRILAVGNSFSADGMAYLSGLAKAAGFNFRLGNMLIGGASLSKHDDCIKNNKAEYQYTLWDSSVSSGNSVVTGNVSIAEVINDAWDYVVVQQVSASSGLYASYFPYLADVLTYLRQHCPNPDMKFAMHQVWAYPQNSTHYAFPNYGSNQMTMYRMVVDASKRAAEESGIDIIIPTGTAIQNGRTSELGDTFNRDESHLNLGYGRYTAACTWFETFFGEPVEANTYVPSNVTPAQASISKAAAHYAILNPFMVTNIE